MSQDLQFQTPVIRFFRPIGPDVHCLFFTFWVNRTYLSIFWSIRPIIYFLSQLGLSFVLGQSDLSFVFQAIRPAACCRGQSGLVFVVEASQA